MTTLNKTSKKYGFTLHVWGDYALFTRPELKVERTSYDVITPSAARGIFEAIYWKPEIKWIIKRIHVLKPIIFQSIRRNEVGDIVAAGTIKKAKENNQLNLLRININESRQQRASSILVDPAYVLEAYFEMHGKEKTNDNNEAKHSEMFKRRARKGQCFHQPCLGTREFAAHFSLIESKDKFPKRKIEDQTNELGFGSPRDLGFMLWDLDYKNSDKVPLLFRATLSNGIIDVPLPGSTEIKK
ncbi:MAG: type I-C CRISPR-associated protein Cas5c [Rhodobacteraceae bacterium]|nr:type I-C CRISPR-associated protein Cas5c [Paracoccaceae bacterium]